MKVITTNLLNRFWKNGIKPVKDAITGKLDNSKVVNSLLTTAAGYALDARQGKILNDKVNEVNSKLQLVLTPVKIFEGGYLSQGATYNFDAGKEIVPGGMLLIKTSLNGFSDYCVWQTCPASSLGDKITFSDIFSSATFYHAKLQIARNSVKIVEFAPNGNWAGTQLYVEIYKAG